MEREAGYLHLALRLTMRGAASALILCISAVCTDSSLFQMALKFGGITKWRILGTA